MARNNYEYEKRQKDIAKKKKQEEKRRKRFNKSQEQETEETGSDTVDDETVDKS